MAPCRFALVVVVALASAAPAFARRVEVSGRVEVVQVDDFEHGRSRVIHKLVDEETGREYELEGAPADLTHGTHVRVRGRVLRGVRRNGARVIAGASGEALGVTVLDAGMPAAALVAGSRKAIVLLVDFAQDGKTVACSNTAVAATMFTGNPSVDALYREASFGQLSWAADTDGNGSPDVVRVSINDAGNDCDTTNWRSEADAAATAAGVTLSLYQHKVYVLPSTVACSWAGYAQIGCGTSCWAMIATCDRGDVFAHELGHNLGMYHASFDTNDDGAVDTTCPWGSWSGGGEYCDDSDFMGISTNVWRQVNGPHKNQMGWLPSANVVMVSTSGTYTIAPLESTPGSAPVLLRVARPVHGGYYELSFRRRVGFDATMRLDYAERTSIHAAPGGNTLMVNFLADGQSYRDAADGILITQLSHDTSGAHVAVSMTCGNGVVDPGEECDGTALGGATCGGCAGTVSCTPTCRLDYSGCTNGVCDANETCAGCAADCVNASGSCCGDGLCGAGETYASCPRDCPPCVDADGDGWCASQGDCNDANPNVHPGATELCSGGVDENCNGLVDCADPACSSSPACSTCLPSRSSCTSGGQCCSGSCGGKKGRRTCR